MCIRCTIFVKQWYNMCTTCLLYCIVYNLGAKCLLHVHCRAWRRWLQWREANLVNSSDDTATTAAEVAVYLTYLAYKSGGIAAVRNAKTALSYYAGLQGIRPAI